MRKVTNIPIAIGEYIRAAGKRGAVMTRMSRKFKIDPHQIGNKIYAARHVYGMPIHYDRRNNRYFYGRNRAKI
jgi:hypothetical protein